MVCIRSAWLTLGSLNVPLEDPTRGYFCTQLDLGYPSVREQITPNPDRSGALDRTQFFAERTISADITAVASASPTAIDSIAGMFAPFMVPSARPVLHYLLDRPGYPERVITVRASGFAWPIAGENQRDISLQWVAADPDLRDPRVQTVTAWAGASSGSGRSYPLTYFRTYPPGGSSPTIGQIRSLGDVPVRPLLRIYGPITRAQAGIAPPGIQYWVQFLSTATIGSGQYVDVDCDQKTALLNGDPTQSVVTWIDWQNTSWPVIPPGVGVWSNLRLVGQSTSGTTQVQCIWQDRYLT